MYVFFGIILSVLAIVNVGTWLTLTEYLQFNMIYSTVIALGFVAYVWFFREKFRHFYESIWFRKFSSAFISCCLIAVILGFGNYLAFKNVKNFDFSGRHIHSLPPEMKDLLSKVPGPIKLSIISPQHSYNAFRTYMNQLKSEKNDLSFEFFQPHLRPDLLKKHNIEAEQSIVVTYKGRHDVLTSFSHVDFARSFKKLMNAKRIVIGFSSNHNEASLKSKDGDGLKSFGEFLAAADIQLVPVDLRSNQFQNLKKEISSLFVWGPKVDFTKEELSSLDELITEGKNVIVALDPSVQKDNVPALRAWTKNYGVFIQNSFVIDKYSFVNGSNGTVPLVQQQWGGKEFYNLKMPIFFPLTSHIQAVNMQGRELDGKIEIEPLLASSQQPHSWAEMNHNEMIQQQYLYNSTEDFAGPVTLSALVKVQNMGSLLLLGNSKLVENNYSKFMNNFDFLLKNVEHLSYSKSEIKLSMPMVQAEPMFVNGIQIKLVFYLSIFVFPLIGLLTAYFTYRIRLKS
jgi:hypothetical protein